MQELILELIRVRAKALTITLALAIPIGMGLARAIPISYFAEMRVFVDSPRMTDNDALTPGEGLEQSGRDKLILTQKGLIDSYSVYKYVKIKLLAEKKDEDAESSDEPSDNPLRHLIKDAVVGKEISVILEAISDPNYQKFKELIFFKPVVASGFFLVGFRAADPNTAVRVTRLLYEGLVELHREMQEEQRQRVSKFIDKKLQEARDNLAQVESEIQVFIKRTGVAPNQEYIASANRSLPNIQVSLSQAELDLKEKQIRFEEARSMLRKLTSENSGETGAPNTSTILSEIEQLEAALIGRSAATNPALQQDVRKRLGYLYELLKSRTGIKRTLSIEAIRNYINQATQKSMNAESDLRIAEQLVQNKKAEAEKFKASLNESPAVLAEYNKLQVKANHYTKLIDSMTKHYILLLAKSDGDFSRMHAISNPLIDEKRAIKEKYRNFFLVWGFLCLITLGGILGRDYLRQTILLPWQLSDISALGFLGIFPRPRLRKNSLDNSLDEIEVNPVAAAFTRMMKRSLSKPSEGGQLILLAGQCPSEHRILFALGVGGELAKTGASVLMINCHRENGEAIKRFYPRNKRRFRTNKSLKDLLDYLTDEGKAGVAAASVLFIPFHQAPTMKKQFKLAQQFFDYVLIISASPTAQEMQALVSEDDTLLLTCSYGATSLKGITGLASRTLALGVRNISLRSVLISPKNIEADLSGGFTPTMTGPGGPIKDVSTSRLALASAPNPKRS